MERSEAADLDTVQLNEVIVTPKGRKYSKKNNPAVDLMQRIRQSNAIYDPHKSDFASDDTHETITLALDGVSFQNDGSGSFRSLLGSYVDTFAMTGKAILPFSVRERDFRRLWRKNPKSDRVVVTKRHNVGFGDNFNADEIAKFTSDILKEVDIFGNDIILLQTRIVSPLSNIAADYYKYFITDTLMMEGDKCIELSFAPHTPEAPGFNGKIYVTLLPDSSAFVKRVEMRAPKHTSLNYVDNMFLTQIFELDSKSGKRNKVFDEVDVEFSLIPSLGGLFASRVSTSHNFSYDEDTAFGRYYGDEGDVTDIAEPEDLPGPMIEEMRKHKWFYWTEKILSIIVKDYVPTRKKNSKIDIGPITSFISFNDLEGFRPKIGGMTTAALSRHLFARGYVAYGFKDRKWKYDARLEYSFTPKRRNSNEFPIHSLTLEHSYDVDQIGQHYLFVNPDNIFIALKRKENKLMTYRRLTTLTWLMERVSGWAFSFEMRLEQQQSSPFLTFKTVGGESIKSYNQNVFKASVRYAPGETFYQSATGRTRVNLDAPLILLTQEYGPKGFLGSDYEFNKTELSIKKRFWFSSFGYLDTILKGGIIWSEVPYPALTWANANLSYTVQPESFCLLNPMEFATDKFVSWDLTYYLNGLIFNRIPLFNRLRIREVVAFRGYYGTLSDKNNPAKTKNNSLLQFPEDSFTRTMSKMPYMEISVGLDNILTILRIDYVWRLSYLDVPGIDRSGLRVALHFAF